VTAVLVTVVCFGIFFGFCIYAMQDMDALVHEASSTSPAPLPGTNERREP